RAIVEEAARDAVAWQRQVNVAAEAELLARIRRDGVTVIELRPAERDAFARATRIVWEQLEPVVGADIMEEFRVALGRGSAPPPTPPARTRSANRAAARLRTAARRPPRPLRAPDAAGLIGPAPGRRRERRPRATSSPGDGWYCGGIP